MEIILDICEKMEITVIQTKLKTFVVWCILTYPTTNLVIFPARSSLTVYRTYPHKTLPTTHTHCTGHPRGRALAWRKRPGRWAKLRACFLPQKIAASAEDFIETSLNDGSEKSTFALETALSAWRNHLNCEGRCNFIGKEYLH